MSGGGVVGFDLGNLNCVICQAKRGSIDTVLNENSKRKTSFYVSFQGKQRFKGEAAVPLAKSNYKNTVTQIKRLLGRSWSEPGVQQELAFMPNPNAFVQTAGDNIGVKVLYNDEEMVFSTEEIAAMLIGQLKQTVAVANEGVKATDIVLSVPGYWTDRQRRSLLDACSIAGVRPLNLLNDHTAAALAYGIYKSARQMFDANNKQHVMFIDVGHADTSVSITAFVQGKLQVVTANYDRSLGGRDFDRAIMLHFAEEFKQKHKLDALANPKAVIKLLAACEKAKQTLTPDGVAVAKVQVEFLLNEIDFKSELTLDLFEQLCAPLVARLEAPILKCLEEAKLTPDQLSAVEIIGGGCRPRCVKRRISEVLGLDKDKGSFGLSTTLNADECIARGCALNSAMLSPLFRVKDFVVGDVVDLPIRLTWEQSGAAAAEARDAMEEDEEEEAEKKSSNSIIIMQRHTETPKTRRVTFRRREPFEIVAAYDEEALAFLPPGVNTHLSSHRISGMPNNPDKDMPKIRVNVSYARDGTFTVSSAQLLEEVIPVVEEKEKEEGEKKEEKNEDAMETEEKEGKKEAPAGEGDAKDTGEKDDANTAEDKDKDVEMSDKDKDTTKENEQGQEQAKEKEKEKPKKKQYKRIELKVESQYTGSLSAEALKASIDREAKFEDQDRIIAETAAMRNALETFVYSYRDRVDGELRSFVTEEEGAAFKAQLEKEESWLYDEGFDEVKAEYEKHLNALKEQADRFEVRYIQQQERPQAARALTAAVDDFLAVVNSTDEKYDHLTDEERGKVRTACDEALKWLDSQSAGQEKLPQTSDPVLTSGMIYEELRKVQNVSNPIVSKKKPPPPKPKEEKKEEKKAEEAKGEGVEKEKEDAMEEDKPESKGEEGEGQGEAGKEGEDKKDTEPMETDLD